MAVSNVQVQMGRRSLDLPLANVSRLPTLSVLQQHTRTIFSVPSHQAPVFFHDDARISSERAWAALLQAPTRNLTLRMRAEPQTAFMSANPTGADPLAGEPELVPEQDSPADEPCCERRLSYFAVQGKTGNTTLYLEKADFDRRMVEFAREGSLAPGMRAIFPPAFKEEYTRLFRDAGAGVVVTTQATALLKRWHKNVAIGGGLLVGAATGGLLASGLAESAVAGAVVAGGVTAEGAAAAAVGASAGLAAEGAATAAATEATASAFAAEAVGSGSTTALGVGATAVAAVAVGYLTFRSLQWFLPEMHKEPYTILMGVPEEDAGMLELGRQMSMVESSTGPLCGICMEKPQDAAAVPCGHTACHSCMEQLLRRHGGAAGPFRLGGGVPCPHCRNPIRSVQRLYF
eukprot:TRINITY_DN21028_c0_g1_i1.p1 TRINITY_DN21028_c0_g1~~TRINITY_DN21028_c0_g1_i1.p1  ORF type:complete len:431 (-),score=81.85 TRINITY_DN21028_c0_g1_i1:52-1260(-)